MASPAHYVGCPHANPSVAPFSCAACGGWVDGDGTVMDRATALARYPHLASFIESDTVFRAPPPAPAERPARSLRPVYFLIWTALGLGLFIAGAAEGKFGLGIVGGLILLGVIGWALNSSEAKMMRTAPSGTVRIETVRATSANATVKRWAAAGWDVQGQSASKSFASDRRVTITFRKR